MKLDIELDVVILAAGNSSRMQSNSHKVLHKIANLELINHILKSLSKLNISEAILVCDKDLKFENKSDVKISRIHQEKKFGTGHAVSIATEFLNKNITLILYGDTPLIGIDTMLSLINNIAKNNNDLALLLFNIEDTNKPYGRAIFDESNNIQSITEYINLSQDERCKYKLANSGIIAAKTEILKKYVCKIDNNNPNCEYHLTDIVKLLHNKKIGFEITNEKEAIGINSHLDLSDAESFYQEKISNQFLNSGVTLLDKKTVFFSHDTKIGKNVIIYPNVFFGENVIVENNVKILPFSHLEKTILKTNTTIGPFTRIRDSVIVGENSEIGNFVEIKSSALGDSIKVKHLSYLGDCEIGSHTNIGAGTVICNFDGKNKNRSAIGEDCFIGGNNTIVAPIKIGNHSKTGAGSTITENIPENTLAIGRSLQINKKRKEVKA